jgi:phosphonate transport system substrate-binding protein
MSKIKKIVSFLLILTLGLSLAACGNGSDNTEDKSGNGGSSTSNEVLKIGAIPDQSSADLNESMDKLAKYLEEKTGMKVEYVPSQDYAALVTAFERGEIHLGWFGGLTGVQAMNAVPEAEAIAQRPMDPDFQSVFIAQKDLNLSGLEDLKGKTFTFGSESSTSGHLMPRYFLQEEGIDPDADFDGAPNFSGSHDSTYSLVESGAYQAGALNKPVWDKAVEENKVDLNKVDVFYTTPGYYDYNWTINSEELLESQFGEGSKDKVRDALLSMHEDSENQNASDVLDYFQTDRFIETSNENYSKIEEVARQLGLIR